MLTWGVANQRGTRTGGLPSRALSCRSTETVKRSAIHEPDNDEEDEEEEDDEDEDEDEDVGRVGKK